MSSFSAFVAARRRGEAWTSRCAVARELPPVGFSGARRGAPPGPSFEEGGTSQCPRTTTTKTTTTKTEEEPGASCYYRVAHRVVNVRSAPELDAPIMGRLVQGATVEGRRVQENWVDVSRGRGLCFVLVDGASLGLGVLLKAISRAAHEAAEERVAFRAAAEAARIEGLVGRVVARLGTADEAAVRVAVLRHDAATRITRAHHDACRRIRGKPAAQGRSALADKLVAGSASLLRDLDASGLAVIPVGDDVVDFPRLGRECRRLDADGTLVATIQTESGTRDDRVAWLSEARARDLGCPTVAAVIRLQRGLAAALLAAAAEQGSRTTIARTRDPPPRWRRAALTIQEKTMVAAYGPGGRYRRHSDNSLVDGRPLNARALTVIVYANAQDWDVSRDGGALRFWHTATETIEVAPRAGQVVIFDSYCDHEVRQALADRFALTFWIYAHREDEDRP